MTRLEDVEDRVDDERLAWTCLTILGMLFPAQFEVLVSRYYLDYQEADQATWMSCKVKTIRNLMVMGTRNIKIIAAHVDKAMEKIKNDKN